MLDSVAGFHLASFGSAAILVATQPDASHLALWGVLITSAASVVTATMKRRSDSKRDEKRHDWEREDRDREQTAMRRVLEASDARAAKALEAAAALAATALEVSQRRRGPGRSKAK